MTHRTEGRLTRVQDAMRSVTITTQRSNSRGSTDVSCTTPFRSPRTSGSVDCTGSTPEPTQAFEPVVESVMVTYA